MNSGVHKVQPNGATGEEWFQTDLATVMSAIKAVKDGKHSITPSGKSAGAAVTPIDFREEQLEAVEKTLKTFKKDNEMLWYAKMRFGKTLTALEVIRRQQYRRVIIVTHRPVVDDGWSEDFRKIFFKGNSEHDYNYERKTKDSYYTLDFAQIEKLLNGAKSSLQYSAESIQRTLDDKEQVELIKKIREMEALKFLTGHFALIKGNILHLIKLGEIDDAIRAITTNKITTKSKALSEELITADFVRRFSSELRGIAGNSIDVKLKQQRAGKGKTPYKVVLIDNEGKEISPQDVLSEGENRATSLAAFFAEASGRPEQAPLIVDDPISSLD